MRLDLPYFRETRKYTVAELIESILKSNFFDTFITALVNYL